MQVDETELGGGIQTFYNDSEDYYGVQYNFNQQ